MNIVNESMSMLSLHCSVTPVCMNVLNWLKSIFSELVTDCVIINFCMTLAFRILI